MASFAYGLSYLSEEGIPGSSLNGRDPNQLKNSELQFWLKCHGDSCKGLITKAQLCKRVNDYLNAKTDGLLVDPDVNNIYTRRKRQRLNQGTALQPVQADGDAEDEATNVPFPANGWGTKLDKSPFFTRAQIDSHIASSGKKQNSDHHSLPTELHKAKAFLEDKYLDDIQTAHDQREVKYVFCGPTCAAGKSGFCNHILALMLKVCKYSLYDCKDVRDLRHEEDENPATACTSALQNWHRSRLDGIHAQPVMEVVVSNPTDKGKKTGVVCLLHESRREPSDNIEGLQNLLQSLEGHNSKLGIIQVLDTASIGTLPVIDTRFGQCPVGSFGSYQLSFTESNFSFTSSGFGEVTPCMATEFPPYPSFPLDDFNGSLEVPESLNEKEMELLNKLKLDVIEATTLEQKTQDQADCNEWKQERKLRFTASNFGKIVRRQRNHDKFVKDLLAQKEFTSAAVEHGKKYEPVALKEYEKYMRKIGKPVKVIKSGLFVSPKMPILGCSPDAKVVDLSCQDNFGIGEVKCPSSKFSVSPLDACEDPGFFLENKDGKPTLKKGHVYYDQVQGLMGLTGAQWCDFIVYTSKGLSVERIKFDQEHWNGLCDKLCCYYFKHFLPVAAV